MIVRWFPSPHTLAWLLLPLALSLAGCRPEKGEADNGSSDASTALYTAPVVQASTNIPRAANLNAAAAGWETNAAFVLSTELSPATLVHSATRHLTLFGGMTNAGLGAPRYVAWATREGPRTFNRGDKLDVSVMAEGWVLVWWAGAEGWTNWDCPWVVILQHKPETMSLDDNGLHLDFTKQGGDVVMMPLYGYEKLPLEHFDFRATNHLEALKVKVKTWEWPKVITRDPLTRIRYWTAITRDFPIHCEETFSVDRNKGTVTVRSKIHRHAIADDWKSRRVKIAPISPGLALAALNGAFPVRFSERWFDLEVPTPFGPSLGIEGVDEFDTTFPALRYINEHESVSPQVTPTNAVGIAALELLKTTASAPDASLRTIPGAYWYARALPFAESTARSNTTAALRTFLSASLTRSEDAEALLPAVWAYAHYSGDWEFVRANWASWKERFVTPRGMTWAGYGRAGIGSIGEAASASIAFARLAYQAGDLDAYHYGCLAFVRELSVIAGKQRGAGYFRKHQPWHSMDVIGATQQASGYLGSARGWQLAGTHQATTRWERFHDVDVARFCRDYLSVELREEWSRATLASNNPWTTAPAAMPSAVQLRSLLLNESPGESVTTPPNLTMPGAGVIANCLAVLRVSAAPSLQRLIPAAAASPWVIGIERENSLADAGLMTSIPASETSWTEMVWPEWRTPIGATWSFGQIRTSPNIKPGQRKRLTVNWNSYVESLQAP